MVQLPLGDPRDGLKSRAELAAEDTLGVLRPEGTNHQERVYRLTFNVKQQTRCPAQTNAEKVLAARRAGIRRVILPKENRKDLQDLPDPVRQEMEFVFVEKVEDLLAAAIPELAERLTVDEAGVKGA